MGAWPLLVVNDASADLIGYLSAVSNQPGFLVPVFQTRASNMLLVQDIGPDGNVRGFRDVVPRGLEPVSSIPAQAQRIGAPAIWGFRFEDGTTHFASQGELKRSLTEARENIHQPFLRLQVSQFCEQNDHLIEAWRTAFRHLAARAPRSADAWRDVVIVPAQVRVAVAHTILKHGLDASIDDLDRNVKVEIEQKRLILSFGHTLHQAFEANRDAQETLEDATLPVRKAFDLAAVQLSVSPQDAAPAAPQKELSPLAGVAVVAIESMAISALQSAIPGIEWEDELRVGRRPMANGRNRLMDMTLNAIGTIFKGPTFSNTATELDSILVQDGELKASGPLSKLDGMDLTSPVIIACTQLSVANANLVDAAISFAKERRGDGKLLIAVIPHLPDSDPEEMRFQVERLSKCYDAIWFLSDRSPHIRQSLPFGPARSVPAAAAHLSSLLYLAGSGWLSHQESAERRSPFSVGIVGSAVGDRSEPSLASHAISRIGHYLLDPEHSTSVNLLTSSPVVSEELQRSMAGAFPGATVETSLNRSRDLRSDRFTVAMAGLQFVEPGPKRFELHCRENARRLEWRFDQAASQVPTEVATHRDLKNVPIDYKHTSSGGDMILRKGLRRAVGTDEIVLTNVTIRRRTFAYCVLRGRVPVHYSRIAVMHKIYKRRFEYALSYLKQSSGISKFIAVPALDYIRASQAEGALADFKLLGRVGIQQQAPIVSNLSDSGLRIELPLKFTRGRGENAYITYALAVLRLSRDGWELVSVGLNMH